MRGLKIFGRKQSKKIEQQAVQGELSGDCENSQRRKDRSAFVDPKTGSLYNPDSRGEFTVQVPIPSSSQSSPKMSPSEPPSDNVAEHSKQQQHSTLPASERSSNGSLGDHLPANPNVLDNLTMAYNAIPVLEQTKLPRGGVSVETKALGRVQVR